MLMEDCDSLVPSHRASAQPPGSVARYGEPGESACGDPRPMAAQMRYFCFHCFCCCERISRPDARAPRPPLRRHAAVSCDAPPTRTSNGAEYLGAKAMCPGSLLALRPCVCHVHVTLALPSARAGIKRTPRAPSQPVGPPASSLRLTNCSFCTRKRCTYI
ncbi:hypothetical protein AcV5_009624 [Taiwanofungus camphoratus]|nr:hypothetical protein AcV5_009624 [Antrodia cinnamomea]